MLRTLLDKLYQHALDPEKEEVVNILSVNLTQLQWDELARVEHEIDEEIAPPDPLTEEELAARYPGICDGCEE